MIKEVKTKSSWKSEQPEAEAETEEEAKTSTAKNPYIYSSIWISTIFLFVRFFSFFASTTQLTTDDGAVESLGLTNFSIPLSSGK